MKTRSDIGEVSVEAGKSFSVLSLLRPLYQMMKPTISLLVVVTVLPTLIMANGSVPSIQLTLATLIGTFLASGSAGIFNHLADSDIDGFMKRTSTRPLPSGKVSEPIAFAVATALGILSLVIPLASLAVVTATRLAIEPPEQRFPK